MKYDLRLDFFDGFQQGREVSNIYDPGVHDRPRFALAEKRFGSDAGSSAKPKRLLPGSKVQR